MEKNKSSISKAETYQEIGKFWDENDVTDFEDQIEPVKFEVEIQSNITYFPIEFNLSNQLTAIARRHGVSRETLLNLWIQEKMAEETTTRQ